MAYTQPVYSVTDPWGVAGIQSTIMGQQFYNPSSYAAPASPSYPGVPLISASTTPYRTADTGAQPVNVGNVTDPVAEACAVKFPNSSVLRYLCKLGTTSRSKIGLWRDDTGAPSGVHPGTILKNPVLAEIGDSLVKWGQYPVVILIGVAIIVVAVFAMARPGVRASVASNTGQAVSGVVRGVKKIIP